MSVTGFPVDPHVLSRHSTRADLDRLLLTVGSDSSCEAVRTRAEEIRATFDRLPPTEADALELYFFGGHTQAQIADIFGVRQPSIHYRLRRGMARVRFWLALPDISTDQIREAMSPLLDAKGVDVMCLMAETGSQTRVAERLSMNQSSVRYRFLRGIDAAQRHGGLDDIATFFGMIRDDPHIMAAASRRAQPGNALIAEA